jgi:hypothetical protein
MKKCQYRKKTITDNYPKCSYCGKRTKETTGRAKTNLLAGKQNSKKYGKDIGYITGMTIIMIVADFFLTSLKKDLKNNEAIRISIHNQHD